MVHNQYVNMHGGVGHCIPDDLAMEFMNKEAKPYLQHAPIWITQVFERAGKSLKVSRALRDNIDKMIDFRSSIGRHEKNSYQKEVKEMVSALKEEYLFKIIPKLKMYLEADF